MAIHSAPPLGLNHQITVNLVMHTVDSSEKLPVQQVLDREVVKVGGHDWNIEFTLDDQVAFPQVEGGLRSYLEKSRGWFSGQDVTVNVGNRLLAPGEMDQMKHVFEEEFQLKVSKLRSATGALEDATSDEDDEPPNPGPEESPEPQSPLLVKSTCRSGTAIHHDGDVVVRGDLNPGAEVVATGDIIVLGTLRGIAHAGCDDLDTSDAVIIALLLRPLQLRIGRHVSIAPPVKGKRQLTTHPEIAYVSERSIIVASYTGKFERL